MKKNSFEHLSRKVEIPSQEDSKRMRLAIDGITHIFSRDAAGNFFLHNYAYDRSDDITDVVKRYLEQQAKEHSDLN